MFFQLMSFHGLLRVLSLNPNSLPLRQRPADFATYRQTFTQVHIFLKFSQWHCCSIRQFLPLVSCALAVAAINRKSGPELRS